MPTLSQVVEWLNENQYRAFPLRSKQNENYTSGAFTLTDNMLLDAQLIFNNVPNSTANFSTYSVGITQIVVSSSTVTFNLNGGAFSFVVSRTGTFPQYVRDSNGSHSLITFGSDLSTLNTLVNGSYTISNLLFVSSVVYPLTAAWNGIENFVIQQDSTGVQTYTSAFELEEGTQVGLEAISPSTIEMVANYAYGLPILTCTVPPEISECNSDDLYAINVTNGGTGYTVAPAITIMGGGGTGATATSTVSLGSVTGITLTNPGTGYTFAPTVIVDNSIGNGATATAIMNRIVSTINGVDANSSHVLFFTPTERINIINDPTDSRIYVGLPYFADDVCPVLS